MNASSARTLALDIHILGRSYKIACKEEGHTALLDAVSMLDERMQAIYNSNKSVSIERIAVIAALNLVNELLQMRTELDNARRESATMPDDVAHVQRWLHELHQSIDRVLAEPEKLL